MTSFTVVSEQSVKIKLSEVTAYKCTANQILLFPLSQFLLHLAILFLNHSLNHFTPTNTATTVTISHLHGGCISVRVVAGQG
jgi:hypothetical protein